jgi:guanine deaminase
VEKPPKIQKEIKDFLADYDVDEVYILSHEEFIIPGFIDCHTHAVQFPNLGLGYDKPLLDWLETYTFPLEKKYTDTKFAEEVFGIVVVWKCIIN